MKRGITLEEADELARMMEPKSFVAPVQKPLSAIPKPIERPENWIKHNDVVVFIIIDRKGKPRFRTGHVCSWPGSHGAGFEVDNIKRTIVWSDHEVRMADNADDAHEKGFDPKDPTLLRADELEILKDPVRAVEWFQGINSPEISQQISILLSKPDLGLEDELKEEAVDWENAEESANRKFRWWER